jgi:hypothetical protein
MIIEKIATVDLISDNGNNLYQLNQTYYLRQNNIDILNMEVAAISFNEQFGNTQFPLTGAAFFISIVDKNNKILLDSYPLQSLWNGYDQTSGLDFRQYPIRRFKLHNVDIQKCYFKFSNIAGGPLFSGLIGKLNFYLVEKKTNIKQATWQQSVSTT